MPYIEELELVDFQGHKNTVVYLHKGINVFQGETNKGKTSLIRTISSIFYHNPKSHRLIRHGADKYIGGIKLNTGYRIRKERTKTKSKYLVESPDNVVEKFEAFGNDVPTMVTELIQAPTFDVDNTSAGQLVLNIAHQLDGPFLLAQHYSGIRAKVLTKLTGGNVLDLAIKNNSAELLKEKQKRESIESDIKVLQEQINSMNYLDDGLKKVETLLTVIEKYKKVKEQVQTLNKLIKQYKENLELLEELRSLVHILQEADINKAYTDIYRFKEDKNLLKSQETDFNRYQSVSSEILKLENFLQKTVNVDSILTATKTYFEKQQAFMSVSRTKVNFDKNENTLTQMKSISMSLQEVGTISQEVQQFVQQKSRYQLLTGTYEQYSKISDRIEKGSAFVTKLSQINALSTQMQQFEELKQKRQQFVALYDQVKKIRDRIINGKDFIALFSNVPMLKNVIENVSDKSKLVEILNEFMLKLNTTYEQVNETKRNIMVLDKQLSVQQKEFDKFDTCPLCEQSIKH